MAYLTGPVNAPLPDFTLEYAGLLMGNNTPYDLPPAWQFLDSPPVRSMETNRTWGDGSWAGPDFADVATWQLPVELVGVTGTTFAAAITAFVQACSIQPAGRPLWVKLPGLPVRGVNARVTQRQIPIDLGWGLLSAGALQFRAEYPVWQSLPRTLTLRPSTGTAALHYPLFNTWSNGPGNVLDYGLATAAAYAGVVTNAGNVAAPPYVVISGPTSGWQVTVDGHIVSCPLVLGGGDSMTVDWATGRAQLSSAGAIPVDRTYTLTSRDWALVPAGGSSTITYAGTGGTAAVTVADLTR